jgi:hypothetical protein
MKTKPTLLRLTLFLMLTVAAGAMLAQVRTFRLFNPPGVQLPDAALKPAFLEAKSNLVRYREAVIPGELSNLTSFNPGDIITIDLFRDTACTGAIQRIDEHSEGCASYEQQQSFGYGKRGALFDAELTLQRPDNNAFIQSFDGGCSSLDKLVISWVADFTGDVKLIFTGQKCQISDQACCRLAYKSGGLEFPYVSITPRSVTVTADQGSMECSITSNTIWTLNENTPWISSVIPSNGMANATVQVSYSVNPGQERSGIINAMTPKNTVSVMITQASPLPVIPASQTAGDSIVKPYQTVCFNALENITVGGIYGSFTVQDTGSAYFIAGQRIRFLLGTSVRSGGYLKAWISFLPWAKSSVRWNCRQKGYIGWTFPTEDPAYT